MGGLTDAGHGRNGLDVVETLSRLDLQYGQEMLVAGELVLARIDAECVVRERASVASDALRAKL